MERLTRRWGPEEKQISGHAICEFNHCPEDTTCASCVYGQKNNRLADIEDILGDNYDLDRLRELVNADREGQCVVLPVKEGETVYCITWSPFEDDPPEIFDCAFHITDYYSIGRTVFLTEEEAEKAIEKMKASENDG